MKSEKPKIIRRKPLGNSNEEPKIVRRKPLSNSNEEPKIVRRKPAGNESEDRKIVRRKPISNSKEDPKIIRRKSAENEKEDPKIVRRKPMGYEKKETKVVHRKPMDYEKEETKTVRRKKISNDNDDLLRLNKYIANSGICSRREADRMIEAGMVSVNGKIVTELGTKVSLTDKVKYADEIINREKPRYLLLNKPKGFITTVDDPENRKTVMTLVAGACKERIYPVGRLDRNTTGLLLFTNDGNIAKKLSHPRYGIKKIYHIELEKSLTKFDYDKISEGFKLEDDFVKVDAIEYIGDGKDKKQIGIELHSGKNRIVRRIFEFLAYEVVRLDRVYYAGLTKKNLPRGTWRFLEEQEINMLKMISSKP